MVSPGPITAIRILQEHVEWPGFERAVLPVVGDACENLPGPRQRGAQTHVGEWRLIAVPCTLLRPGRKRSKSSMIPVIVN